MSEHGVMVEPGTIRFERVFPGPIERIWAYLTDSDKRSKWLAAGQMDLRTGGKVELIFRHADLSPESEEIPEKYREYENGARLTGRITACDPPRLLRHTWPEGSDRHSEVTYELIPQGEDVRLVLTHRLLGDDRDTLLSVSAGWHTHLGILTEHLSGKTPKPFWTTHAALEDEYEKLLFQAESPESR